MGGATPPPRATAHRSRAWAAWALLLAGLLCAPAPAAVPGESIYREGRLANGEPVTARRDPNLRISGVDAACANCHRRSGLGEFEGRISIPPIAGPYLFHARATDRDDFDLPYVETMRPDRDPYTDASLARAIREGIGADGRALGYLMPRYDLDDGAMSALTGYLKGMTVAKAPGATSSVLHFATIVTPDANPVERRGMLDVLEHFFADKNAYSRAETPRLQSSHRMMFKSPRRWELHVWSLTGRPDSWTAQLQEHLKKEPVFAVLSGLGGKTWAPVHEFCEQAQVPCLFPNVALPVVAERDFYSLYFSRGVLLEADMAAQRLGGAAPPRRLVQVFRPDDIGAAAAAAVRTAIRDVPLTDAALAPGNIRPQLDTLLKGLDARDALLLWLRPADLGALGPAPSNGPTVLISGLMGGLEQSPLPADWRRSARMTYPFDLPERRRIRVDYPLGWFRARQIPVVAEQVQTDTWLACGLLSETLNHLADSFMRDYLVERIEAMLEHRLVTGYYPRLALAPNQRFASKGGYWVRFADSDGVRLLTDGDWVVP